MWPFHSPLRTRLAEVRHLVEHGVDLRHHVLAIDHDRRSLRRAQRHMQHRAIFRDVDLLAAEHRVDPRPQGRTPSASCNRSFERLVGDAVLRVVEEEPGRFGGHPLAALRIVREELPKVQTLHFLVMGYERLPARTLCQGRNGGHYYSSLDSHAVVSTAISEDDVGFRQTAAKQRPTIPLVAKATVWLVYERSGRRA